jgi:putative DNA primase/helicase
MTAAIELFPNLTEFQRHRHNCKIIMSTRGPVVMKAPGKDNHTFSSNSTAEEITKRLEENPTALAWFGGEPLKDFLLPPESTPAPLPKVTPKPIEAPDKIVASDDVNTTIPEPHNDNDSSGADSTEQELLNDEKEIERDGEKVSIADADRPCYKIFDAEWTESLEHGWLKAGVYHFGTKVKGDEVVNTHQFICSPLHIDAIASDEHDGNYGRVLRFINSKKKWRTWAMPMEMLSGSGEDLRAELLAMGSIINPDAKQQLLKYLSEKKLNRHVRCATQVGWCGNSFVLPSAVIGPAAINVVFQSGERGQAEYGLRGTLEGWRQDVAALAIGNPVLIMSLSAAFVGPLLEKVNGESGGIHLVDNSSVGKSTAIKAAASVWGGPRHLRSWNATANGMEGVAAMFNDNLLPLDEISECAPHDINRIVYALANGVGKQRASRSGAARSVVRWRCFVISSGERMISTELLNAGISAKAGQLVRILDLPVARLHGVWDDLHDLPNGGAFSDAIRAAVAKHHGNAGPAFLERLTRDGRNWSEQLEAMKRLAEFSVEGDAGQDKRVASRFALIAMAGEVATEFGITGWPVGAATKAAATMFRTWQAQRQHGNREPRQIIEQLAAFIERHGDSRFSPDRGDEGFPVRDRAGWWEHGHEGEGRVYWFNSAGLREALKGFDFERALDVLAEAEVLSSLRGSKGERSRSKKIRGETMRLYQIFQGKLF